MYQKWTKNASKIDQKCFKIHPRRPLGGSWEASGGVLGASWRQDGSKSQKVSKSQIVFCPFGSQNPTKILPKSIWKRSKKYWFFLLVFWSIFEGFWMDFGSQNQLKIDQNSIKNWIKKASTFLMDFCLDFEGLLEAPKAQIHWKKQWFFNDFRLLAYNKNELEKL